MDKEIKGTALLIEAAILSIESLREADVSPTLYQMTVDLMNEAKECVLAMPIERAQRERSRYERKDN